MRVNRDHKLHFLDRSSSEEKTTQAILLGEDSRVKTLSPPLTRVKWQCTRLIIGVFVTVRHQTSSAAHQPSHNCLQASLRTAFSALVIPRTFIFLRTCASHDILPLSALRNPDASLTSSSGEASSLISHSPRLPSFSLVHNGKTARLLPMAPGPTDARSQLCRVSRDVPRTRRAAMPSQELLPAAGVAPRSP